MRRWFCYTATYAVAWPLFRICFRIRVNGRHYIPRGGAIVAANHVSYLDPPLLGYAVGRPLGFMAKSELFRVRPFAWLIRQYGAFPVRRGKTDRRALTEALARLERGEIVLMFPEGGISPDGSLREPKPGIGFVALRSGAPVVPAWIEGTQWALPRGRWMIRPRRVTVTFGAPLDFRTWTPPEGEDPYQAASRLIMDRIASLRQEGARGTPTGPRPAL